jgi:hypothetical protein
MKNSGLLSVILATLVRKEIGRWRKVAKEANIPPE